MKSTADRAAYSFAGGGRYLALVVARPDVHSSPQVVQGDDAAAFLPGAGRFGDIVQQGGGEENGAGDGVQFAPGGVAYQRFRNQTGMDEYIALAVIDRLLGAVGHGLEPVETGDQSGPAQVEAGWSGAEGEGSVFGRFNRGHNRSYWGRRCPAGSPAVCRAGLPGPG